MKIKLPSLKKSAPAKTAIRRVPPKAPPKLKLNAAVARRGARAIPDEEEYYDEAEPNMKLSHAVVVVLVLHVIAVAGVFAFNTIKTRQSPVFAETGVTAPAQSSATNPVAPEAGASTDSATATRTFEPRSVAEAPTAPANAAAVAAPQSASDEKTAAWTGQTHELRPGDTLTRVSSLYGVSIAAIQQENAIEDPTKLRVGAVLRIPAAAAATTAPVETTPVSNVTAAAPAAATESAPPEAAPAAATVGEDGVYEVAAGDNPWSIAKKLGVSYQKLIEVNNIEDATKIQIGQKLKIPTN